MEKDFENLLNKIDVNLSFSEIKDVILNKKLSEVINLTYNKKFINKKLENFIWKWIVAERDLENLPSNLLLYLFLTKRRKAYFIALYRGVPVDYELISYLNGYFLENFKSSYFNESDTEYSPELAEYLWKGLNFNKEYVDSIIDNGISLNERKFLIKTLEIPQKKVLENNLSDNCLVASVLFNNGEIEAMKVSNNNYQELIDHRCYFLLKNSEQLELLANWGVFQRNVNFSLYIENFLSLEKINEKIEQFLHTVTKLDLLSRYVYENPQFIFDRMQNKNVEYKDYKKNYRIPEKYIVSNMNKDNINDPKTLITAASLNEIRKLKNYIGRGVKLNAVDKEQKTALDHALIRKNSASVRFLIKSGSKISANALNIAIDNCDYPTIKFLLLFNRKLNNLSIKNISCSNEIKQIFEGNYYENLKNIIINRQRNKYNNYLSIIKQKTFDISYLLFLLNYGIIFNEVFDGKHFSFYRENPEILLSKLESLSIPRS